MQSLKFLFNRAFNIYRDRGLFGFVKSLIKFLTGSINSRFNRIQIVWNYKKCRIRQQCVKDTDADPLKLVWVEPNDINYCTGTISSGPNQFHLDHIDGFTAKSMFGAVMSGDWDQSKTKFSDLAVCLAIQQRINNKINWEQTYLYQRHVSLLEQKGVSFGRESKKGLEQKIKETDYIIQNIKQMGYKSQYELGTGQPLQEICVNIGRDGEFLFNGGGRHRLAIAQALELESVPVLIKIRHTRWQSIRNEIRTADTLESLSNEARQHINHPDLEDIVPSAWVD